MSADFRALCAELHAAFNTYAVDECHHALLERTRAALAKADEPAVPDGREPAAVTGQLSDGELLEMMPQPFRDDLAFVSRMAAHGAGPAIKPGLFRVSLNTGALDYARAVLARWGNPAPQLPADGEVAEVMGLFRHWAEAYPDSVTLDPYWLTHAAELLQRQALVPVPVPVSERPWEREGWCDTGGLCWLGSDALDGCTPTWLYGSPAWAERFPTVHRVVLPAHALPLPEGGE